MKKIQLTILFGITSLLFLCANTCFSQTTVSIESLLKEMTNRSELAKYPDPAFTCKQFSSYDRGTVAKDKPGWFANDDRSMFLRVEKNNGRREFVMMDTEGPGAIVRFWMTFAGKDCGQGTMRIYVDDYSQPAIEGSALDILSGTLVTTEPLATSVSSLTPYQNRGHNLYFPIPYAQRCKVTYESVNLREDDPGARKSGTEAVYYNINYRTYQPDVKVVSYSAAEMKKHKSLIAKVQKQLQGEKPDAGKLKLKQIPLNATLQAGDSKSFVIKGSYSVQQLCMAIHSDNLPQALRSTVLEIAFDGETTVWSPVGDFYGIGYMPLYTNTWYTHVEKEGLMSAYWVMPFEKECVITLHNYGDRQVVVSDAVAGYAAWKWDARSMHFGTTWQQYTHVYAGPGDLAQDLNFADLQGKGVYVGDDVALFNTTHAWWGEGDEKVFVDGETFPSHIGTGSEDYYGYAWGRPETFTDHPFIAQPQGTGANAAEFAVNTRLRALDKIPFTSSIQFDLELWHWSHTRINYAPIAFWYMLPGGRKATPNDVAGAKEPVATHRKSIYSPALRLTMEGENLIPVNLPPNKIEFQTHLPELWSDGMQIYWREITKGDRGDFEFECDFPGSYLFRILFTIAPDYGQFNIYLNGQLLARDVDLYHPKVSVKEIAFGQVPLRRGVNKISVELTGYPKQLQKSCFGIDRLTFEKP
ncbi:MAG: DUF2961 domain-containing protein [Dysgonamonadaceae bacterium]|jgi:hypothetical protein|nr:DUF2961 domain-containing protein [Dysgonamonadaceae bacterium]